MARIIAHFMHEREKDEAVRLLTVEAETDSYVVGEIDDTQLDALRQEGLIVQELPAGPPPAGPDFEELLGAPRARAMARAAVAMQPEVVTPDMNEPQFFLIWIQGPLIEEWRTRLAQLGVELIEVLPTGAYKARLEPQQVQPVSQLPFVSRLQVLTGLEAAPDFMTRASSEPAPPLAGKQAVAFDILLHRAEDQATVRQWLEARRVSIAGASGRKIRVYLFADAPELNAIPALPEVERMEEFVPPELHNDRGRVLLKIDQGAGVTVTQTGAGQLVAIADTGIDDTHPDFGTRIVGRVGLGRPGVTTDPHGHGTHVAGSIAGDGAASQGAIRGAAPAAEIYFQSLLDPNGKLGGLPLSLGDLFDDAYLNNARIHNNSWGAATGSRYTINASEVDEFVTTHRDMLIIISAGNEGSAAPPLNNSAQGHVDWLSIGSPASCKNALTVGASRSDRATGGRATLTYGQAWPNLFPHAPMANEPISTHPDRIAGFSSRGPTNDRRIKPDVVAPGTDIASTKSSLAPFASFWGPVPGTNRYAYMGGTSMAAPLVSGCAALVREYLAAAQNYAQPSAALVKALLINGTRWLDGWDAIAPAVGTPNYHQGFGCINMADTVPNPARPGLVIRFVDNWQRAAEHFTRTGERQRYAFQVSAPCQSLRVCLAYTDPPARGLQNDLNLFLEMPGGRKVLGNEQLANRLILPDPDNNVEIIRLDNAPSGSYLIQISATNLLRPPQDFALVVTGENVTQLQTI